MAALKTNPMIIAAQPSWNKKFFSTTRAATMLWMSLSLGISTSVLAGYDGTRDWQGACTVTGSPPTNVTCIGTMAGIRGQTRDPERYVYFSKLVAGDYTSLTFTGRFNGTNYSCAAPDTPGWNAAWDSVMMSNAYFRITFDISTGACSLIEALTGSSFKNASAL